VPEKPIELSVIPAVLGNPRCAAGLPARNGSEGTPLNFSALTGVKPKIETYPLDKGSEAFARMESGKARSAW